MEVIEVMEAGENIVCADVRRIYRISGHKKIIVLSVFLFFSLMIFFIITPNAASAENNIKLVKSVTVYQIEEGDSIWSIAKTYYTPECGKLTDYIREIKRSNGITFDTIYTGCYLIIPYYAPQ